MRVHKSVERQVCHDDIEQEAPTDEGVFLDADQLSGIR